MKRETWRCAAFGLGRGWMLAAMLGGMMACGMTAAAQEKGMWRAASSTARSITGDVALSEEKIAIDFSGFPMARIRSLEPGEISAAFDSQGSQGSQGSRGSLYRLSIPATKRFLHHNTLCGDDETQWMATLVSGRSLQLAFFSGAQPPVLTPEAMANATNLCGTYSYER